MAQKPLGVALANSAGAQSPKISKGQLIAGILADALSGAAGQPGQFAAMMNRRQQQEQEEAQWGRRLEQSAQIKAKYDTPDVSPMERDLAIYQKWTPQQRKTYEEMKQAGAPPWIVQDGMAIPNPNKVNSAPPPPSTIDEDLWNSGTPIGGQQANPLAGPFPDVGRYRRF